MHRFFVPQTAFQANNVLLSGDVAHQIGRVLRMRVGDQIALFHGDGYEYRVRLTEINKDAALGVVDGKIYGNAEPAHQVDLYLSLLNKPDKFEWALQKCTELGAANFTPIIAERSVPGPSEKGRRARWERIIQEAAEQSGRTILSPLADKLTLKEALQIEEQRLEASEKHLALIPALGADLSLSEAIEDVDDLESVSLFIGPEGGFSDDELYAADKSGLLLVNMGPRTLRAETAAVAALTIVMHALGNI